MIVFRIPFDVPELRARAGDALSFNPETRRFVVSKAIGPDSPGWSLAWDLARSLAPVGTGQQGALRRTESAGWN